MANTAVSEQLKTEIGGMLSPAVYAELAAVAARAKAPIVEIGTCTGAATIALALGAPDGVAIHSVDRWDLPRWRQRIGSPEACRQKVLETFQRFGVGDRINLIAGTSTDLLPHLGSADGLGMLFVDADGALDRDFGLLLDRVVPGAPIVVDDYGDYARFIMNGRLKSRIDQKHRLTYMLVELFVRHGLLSSDKLIKETWFGHKPATAPAFATLDHEEIIAVYRRLTFASGRTEPEFRLKLINWMKLRQPAMYRALWKMRHAVGG
jgi:predicted O-methyltransferase YrrM